MKTDGTTMMEQAELLGVFTAPCGCGFSLTRVFLSVLFRVQWSPPVCSFIWNPPTQHKPFQKRSGRHSWRSCYPVGEKFSLAAEDFRTCFKIKAHVKACTLFFGWTKNVPQLKWKITQPSIKKTTVSFSELFTNVFKMKKIVCI